MSVLNFKPRDHRSTTENSNFLSIGCRETKKHGPFDKDLCIFAGTFHFNPLELYQFVANNVFAKRWCFVERRTEYFKLFFDFDINKYLPDIETIDVNSFIDNLIENIIKGLTYYIVLTDHIVDYIYSDRADKFNFHLYFPNIILNQHHAIAIRKKIIELLLADNKFNLTIGSYENIVDKSVYENAGLKLLFQAKPHETEAYKINIAKSTYKNIPADKYNQLLITSIRTDNGQPNINFIKDDTGCPLIAEVIETQNVKQQNMEVIEIENALTVKEVDGAIVAVNKPVNVKVKRDVIMDKTNQFVYKLDTPEKILKALFNNLKIERFTDFFSWLKIMFLCMNYGLRKMAHDVSKKCPDKYDEDYIDRLFDNKTGVHHDNPITTASLFKWSKEDNPDQHKLIVTEQNKDKKFGYAHTDDILLQDFDEYTMTKYAEHSFRISKELLLDLCQISRQEKMVIILHQNTGNGKTYNTTEIIKEKIKQLGENIAILSIISRRSMSDTHMKAFKSINMTSYLNGSNNKDRLILSLEQVQYVKQQYDVLILDEFNSLIAHFYSKTMSAGRFKCLHKLIELIRNADTIIIADATITDMGLIFITSLRTNIVYYRNTFKNKEGVNLNVHYVNDKESSSDDKIIKFSKQFKAAIKLNQNVMIVCDSATIATKLRNYLTKWNKSPDYFKLYTAKNYNMDEVINCNETWVNKCVIASPKIVYGLDCQLQYNDIYAVYKCKSINSIGFLQQISRARDCNQVNILFIENNYINKVNEFISFEENKVLEIESFNNYLNGINAIANKQNNVVIQELCSKLLTSATIDEQSLFGKVHMRKSWYDRLFNTNKAQLFLDLCREQGYNITFKVLDKITAGNSLKSAITLHDEEQMYHQVVVLNNELERECNDLFLLNLYNNFGDHEKKFSDFSNHEKDIREQFKSKLKYLGIFRQEILKDEILETIMFNDDVFAGCIRSLPLYYNKEAILKNQISEFEKGLAFIDKDDKVYIRIKLLKWIEDYFIINRFEVNKIYVTKEGASLFVTELKKLTNLLPAIINYQVTSLKRLDTRTSKKLDHLISEDKIRKFVADIYNMFDKIVSYNVKYNQIWIDEIKVNTTSYENFAINNITLNYHKKFISKQNAEYRFIN